MSDELATVLRLVAEGRLTPEEAAPIIEALQGAALRPAAGPPPPPPPFGRPMPGSDRRRVRIQVSDSGRRVVDVRVPMAFAAIAARAIPGIPDEYATLIREAVDGDMTGPIVEAEDEDGDGVRISIE